MVRRTLLSLMACWVIAQAPQSLFAQGNWDNDGYAQLSPIDAVVVLKGFRASRVPDDFCLKFNIVHKPRRGESSAPVTGTLWASWASGGPRIRIEMAGVNGATPSHFLAIKNPQQTELWFSAPNQVTQKASAQNQPPILAPGLLLTAFDLQMPFTHWSQTTYLATERARGRPVHFYVSTNPDSALPQKVRFGIDRSYGALTEATYYNQEERVIRFMQIEDFAKVDEQWMISTCSVRDETTRDIDTLKITEAAVHLQLPNDTFSPDSLSTPTVPLPAEKFKPL